MFFCFGNDFDALYSQEAKLYCGGDYVNIDPNNTLCVTTMQKIKLCLLQINLCQILEPQCAFSSRRSAEELDFDYRIQEAEFLEHFLSSNKLPELPCRVIKYDLSSVDIESVDTLYALI